VNKSLKNMPRFTAEASLYSTSYHCHVHGMYQEAEKKVYLADFIDQACLGECKKDCGTECAGTTGSGKAACIHQCAADNAECSTICTRPGNPPTGGGGGGGTGGGGNPCAPGTPCAGLAVLQAFRTVIPSVERLHAVRPVFQWHEPSPSLNPLLPILVRPGVRHYQVDGL
jgi:hypothetical protein